VIWQIQFGRIIIVEIPKVSNANHTFGELYKMNKNDDKASQDSTAREERMEKIRGLISNQSEDAAKVLKMWLEKSADKGKKK